MSNTPIKEVQVHLFMPESSAMSRTPSLIGSPRAISNHVEDSNISVQDSPVKIENFQWKTFDIFLIFAQNIDCGYTLEPPRRGGSNEYPHSMFWSKNKKNRYAPANPSFAI